MKIFKFSAMMLLLILFFGACKKEAKLLPDTKNETITSSLQQEFEMQFKNKVDSRGERVNKGIWGRITPNWKGEVKKSIRGEAYSVIPIEFDAQINNGETAKSMIVVSKAKGSGIKFQIIGAIGKNKVSKNFQNFSGTGFTIDSDGHFSNISMFVNGNSSDFLTDGVVAGNPTDESICDICPPECACVPGGVQYGYDINGPYANPSTGADGDVVCVTIYDDEGNPIAEICNSDKTDGGDEVYWGSIVEEYICDCSDAYGNGSNDDDDDNNNNNNDNNNNNNDNNNNNNNNNNDNDNANNNSSGTSPNWKDFLRWLFEETSINDLEGCFLEHPDWEDIATEGISMMSADELPILPAAFLSNAWGATMPKKLKYAINLYGTNYSTPNIYEALLKAPEISGETGYDSSNDIDRQILFAMEALQSNSKESKNCSDRMTVSELMDLIDEVERITVLRAKIGELQDELGFDDDVAEYVLKHAPDDASQKDLVILAVSSIAGPKSTVTETSGLTPDNATVINDLSDWSRVTVHHEDISFYKVYDLSTGETVSIAKFPLKYLSLADFELKYVAKHSPYELSHDAGFVGNAFAMGWEETYDSDIASTTNSDYQKVSLLGKIVEKVIINLGPFGKYDLSVRTPVKIEGNISRIHGHGLLNMDEE